jgi:hypothetical protein
MLQRIQHKPQCNRSNMHGACVVNNNHIPYLRIVIAISHVRCLLHRVPF